MIETKNLTKKFGELTAVERLSISVKPGEVFGFLGPNGAGKTTTIRMLCALIKPTRGSADVAGYTLGSEDDQIRRNVGILTESPGLYNRLSAERNLDFFAQLYAIEDVAGKIAQYLQMLGLWDRRNEAVGTFSKGMRQKLAIARALLHEPDVLFLDEPTSGLDPEAARLVHDFLDGLKREGRTIFITTHNLDEADRLCDRIAVFNRELLALDTPSALKLQLYGRAVIFHLVQPGDPFIELVTAFPFVESAEASENRILVRLDDPEAHNPALVRALVEAGADIQFVGEIRKSLEDVYLQLVTNENESSSS